jgi:hypothetical protein
VNAIIRRAEPGDAEPLVRLAEAVGSEEGGWLIADGCGEGARRSAVPEGDPQARLLGGARRRAGRRIVGRLSIGRDTHPASEHVADVGLMVADGYRRAESAAR